MTRLPDGRGPAGLGIVPLVSALSLLALLAVATATSRQRDAAASLAEPSVTVVARQPALVEAAVGKASPLPGVAGVRIPGPSAPPLPKELSDLLGDYNGRTFFLVLAPEVSPAELSTIAARLRALPEVEEVGADPVRRAALLRDRALGDRGFILSVALTALALAAAVALGASATLRAGRRERALLESLGAPPSGPVRILVRRGLLPLLLVWTLPWVLWLAVGPLLSIAAPGPRGTLAWFGAGLAALAAGALAGIAGGRPRR